MLVSGRVGSHGPSFRVLAILLVAAVTLTALPAAAMITIGEHHPASIRTDQAGPETGWEMAGRIWRYRLSHPGATYIAVHFAEVALPDGDVLLVSDDAGGQSYELTGQGKMEAGTFWAQHVKGDTLVLELHTSGLPTGHGFAVDEYVAGTVDVGQPTEAICAPDDKENAVCYAGSHPAIYGEAQAVARLFINGSGLCTGWLASAQNHLFTNEHCIASAADALNTDYEFMAEAPSCGDTNCQLCFPGTVFSGADLVLVNADLDYALVQITSGDPASTYGYLEIDDRDAVVGEQIYIPQHPAGRAKELAIYSTHASDTGGVCRVYSITEPACTGVSDYDDVGYYCDTEGGSSGSPVLAASSNEVIALHHCADCPNRGVPIDLVCDEACCLLDDTCPACPVYTITEIPYGFEDIKATGTNLGLTDDGYELISIPFSFRFYGQSYNKVVVGDNGGVYFTSVILQHQNICLPGVVPGPQALIAAYWDDLNTAGFGAGVFWEVRGSAPDRRVIIQYDDVPRYTMSTSPATFQVVLFEDGGRIQLRYEDVDFGTMYSYGKSATVGVQRDPTCATQFLCATADLENSMALELVPAGGADDAVLGWSAYGLHGLYNDTTWDQLHPIGPELVAAGDFNGTGLTETNEKADVAVDFGPAYGLYIYYDDATWTKVNPVSPELMAVGDLDNSGKADLVVDFGPSYGLFVLYNNTTWTKVNPVSPVVLATGNLDGSGGDELLVGFGPAYGFYVLYNNTTWKKVNPVSPELLAVGDLDGNGKDDVLVDFGSGYGLYLFRNNTTWQKLNPMSPTVLAAGNLDGSGGDEALVGWPAYGLYRFNLSTWTKLNPVSPKAIAIGDLDGSGAADALVNFGSPYSLYGYYNSSTWKVIHPMSPNVMTCGNLDGQ